jgi:hypothetical protein
MDIHVYPDKKYYEPLFYSSLLTLIPGIFAIYRKYYDFAFIQIAIVLTSINYWRDPIVISWRRYTDIILVFSGIAYTIIRSIKGTNQILYLIFLITGIILFILSWHFLFIKNYELSSDCHMALHIIINIGYMVLYNGFIPKII